MNSLGRSTPESEHEFVGHHHTAPDSKTSGVQLRSATGNDSADLAILADAATRRFVSWTWDQQANEGQSSFEVGRDRIRTDTTYLSYFENWDVAEVDGAVAGGLNSYRLEPANVDVPDHMAAVLEPVTELKLVAEGTWYVSVASVFPEHRGHGIGQALLTLGERKAASADIGQLTLLVGSFNEGAHRLYERLGFVEWQRRPFQPFPGSDAEGSWILMVKDVEA